MNHVCVNDFRLNTLVFDFDGTLAKLNIDFGQMRKEVQNLLRRFDINPRHLHNSFALEMIDEASDILQKGNITKASSFRLEAMSILETIEVEAAKQGELFEGTKKLLPRLKEKKIRVGIITRNCVRAVYTIFPDIDTYCSVVLCRDHVRHVKPHPEHLGLALNRLGSESACALMIGDHPLDIETGHNVGALAAGVLTGHFMEEDFIRAGADVVIEQAKDILNFLRRQKC